MGFRGAVAHFSLRRSKTPARMMCIRPADPQLAISAAEGLGEKLRTKKISVSDFDRQFQDLISLQEYRFAGFLKQPVQKNPDGEAMLVDQAGNPCGWTVKGDSFVQNTIENAAQAAKA
jgi:hypothetical protein